MDPSGHDNLLFDDGAFSRSRRYFWAIDCLSEVGPLGVNVFFFLAMNVQERPRDQIAPILTQV